MSIRIEKINVKSLGPVTELNCELADVNLFYGKNETGKTSLVEFLIRSLFKNLAFPSIRTTQATGQISLTGLSSSPTYFSPSTKKKLEDHLNGENLTIPSNISRLLVVRGAELSLTENHDTGINQQILEEYLSNTGLINKIRGEIPAAVKNSTFSDGIIQGSRIGSIREYQNRKNELEALERFIDQVNLEYSSGLRASLQTELNQIENQKKLQYLAKCYLAYKLNLQVKGLSESINLIPKEHLERLRLNIEEYRTKSTSLGKLQESFQVNSDQSQELPWLKSAVEDYQNLTNRGVQKAQNWPLLLSILFLVLAILSTILRQPLFAVISILLGAGSGFAYILNLRQILIRANQDAELQRISQEFEQKFSHPLNTIATLRTFLNEQQEKATAAKVIQDQILTLQNDQAGLKQVISNQFLAMSVENLSDEFWLEKIQTIQKNVEEMEILLSQLKIELASLQITESEFISEPQGIEFNNTFHKELLLTEEIVKAGIQKEDSRLSSLRDRLSQETRQKSSTPWETLIKSMVEKRTQTASEYKNLVSNILAGIFVNSALDDLYKEEEKSIQIGLSSCNVVDHLKSLTTHYNRIEFNENQIKIADQYSEFNFGDLSTAAKEQVLLALRLGFASRCFFEQPMFLILDDAFQHSDWIRRDNIIENIFKVSSQGWQIIYLTMDDHIRDLFCKKAEKYNSGGFRYFQLHSE